MEYFLILLDLYITGLACYAACACTSVSKAGLMDTSSPLQIMNAFYEVVEQFYPDDPDKQANACVQMTAFREKSTAAWKRPIVESMRRRVAAYQWWQQFGGHAPELQHIAIRLLSQVSSACACERIWSTFDFIHSRRRNQLQVDRAFQLVYIFTNLRLMDKESTDSFHERFPAWRELAEELGSEPEDSIDQSESGSSSADSSEA